MTFSSGGMPSGKKRGSLLVCAVCDFETFSKGGFVWHQTSAHGRAYGSGIPGKKRARQATLDEGDAAAVLDGISAQPRARRRLLCVTEASASGGNGGAAGDGEAEAPEAEAAVHGGPAAGLGALVADEAGSYDAAIRAQLCPLLEMTGALRGDGQEAVDASQRDTDGGDMDVDVPYESLATRIFRLYEALDDAARAVPILERRRNSRTGRFNTARLRALQKFVLGVGGAGLSVREQRLLYNFLEVWDRRDDVDPMAASDNFSLQAVFPTFSSFKNALRDDLVDAVLVAGWRKLRIREGGTVYEVYFRSVLEVVMARLRSGGAGIRLWSGVGGPAPPTNMRQTPMDGDAFRLCERNVVDAHGNTSFVLGLHMYSDSCRVSWSGGKFCTCLVCMGVVFVCVRCWLLDTVERVLFLLTESDWFALVLFVDAWRMSLNSGWLSFHLSPQALPRPSPSRQRRVGRD